MIDSKEKISPGESFLTGMVGLIKQHHGMKYTQIMSCVHKAVYLTEFSDQAVTKRKNVPKCDTKPNPRECND